MEILLTEEQVKNLKVFLSRTQLSGSEVVAYVEILNAISKAEKDEKDS